MSKHTTKATKATATKATTKEPRKATLSSVGQSLVTLAKKYGAKIHESTRDTGTTIRVYIGGGKVAKYTRLASDKPGITIYPGLRGAEFSSVTGLTGKDAKQFALDKKHGSRYVYKGATDARLNKRLGTFFENMSKDGAK